MTLAKFANSLTRLPLALIQVFTWDKSFKTNPIIGNRLLNRLGLHVARLVVSHLFFNFRLALLAPLANAEQRRHFRRYGHLTIENLLPAERFAQLKVEIAQFDGEIREELEGSTITQRLYLTENMLAALPECKDFCHDSALLRLLKNTSSKKPHPLFLLGKHHSSRQWIAKAGPPKRPAHRHLSPLRQSVVVY